jgi:hypothetical protein
MSSLLSSLTLLADATAHAQLYHGPQADELLTVGASGVQPHALSMLFNLIPRDFNFAREVAAITAERAPI